MLVWGLPWFNTGFFSSLCARFLVPKSWMYPPLPPPPKQGLYLLLVPSHLSHLDSQCSLTMELSEVRFGPQGKSEGTSRHKLKGILSDIGFFTPLEQLCKKKRPTRCTTNVRYFEPSVCIAIVQLTV